MYGQVIFTIGFSAQPDSIFLEKFYLMGYIPSEW
jgi:hypothetical protein